MAVYSAAMNRDKQIIESLGGSTEVARLCNNAITPQAVQQWKARGIPCGWRLWLHSQRPEAFEVAKPTANQSLDSNE